MEGTQYLVALAIGAMRLAHQVPATPRGIWFGPAGRRRRAEWREPSSMRPRRAIRRRAALERARDPRLVPGGAVL